MPQISFAQWVDFTFGLGMYSIPLRGPYPGSAEDAIEHCIRFFENPGPIVSHLPHEKVSAALDDMPSIDGYGGLISYEKLAEVDRFRLVDSHYALFRDLFTRESFPSAVFLWWESLIGASWDDGPAVGRNVRVCDRVVGVLVEILNLSAEECIRSALHGLNEFAPNCSNPELRAQVVSELLRSNRLLSPTIRSYAVQVATGEAQ